MVVPGVRLQASEALSDGVFVIRVRDVPYMGGRVPAGGRLSTDIAASRDHGLDGEPLPNAWLGPHAGVGSTPTRWLGRRSSGYRCWILMTRCSGRWRGSSGRIFINSSA